MAAPKWQAATLYETGAIVQPASATSPLPAPIVNPNFQSNADGWILPAEFSYDGGVSYSGGGGSVRFNNGLSGYHLFLADDPIPCSPGQSITFSCMCQQGATSKGFLALNALLYFFDASDNYVGSAPGTVINDGSGGAWHKSQGTGVAPAGTAYARLGAAGNRIGENHPAWVDNFVWNHVIPGTIPGLVFRAVQPTVGLSGSSEPVWPTVNGVQVVDNEVTWEALFATRVEWTAKPLFKSGATEPSWPTTIGGVVQDNTINWTAVTREITDPNCPRSKVAFILASKVFAVDDDIVRFCATLNAKDWTTENDAGFLATGLQAANANEMAVLNQYRSNLVAMNADGFQAWVADPDPERMTVLDQLPGIGSIYNQAACAVANELFVLTAVGVRTITIAAGAENLAAGDIGEPIDPLVQAAISVLESTGLPVRSTWYPGLGQYWLALPGQGRDGIERGVTTVYVHTARKGGGSWSMYQFPFEVRGFAQLNNYLYMLCSDMDAAGVQVGNDYVVRVQRTRVTDAGIDAFGNWENRDFPGEVEWLFIDTSAPGMTGELEAVDVVCTGQAPTFDVGYDQTHPEIHTEGYLLPTDTLPGCPYAYPVSAPTMAPRLRFAGGQAWSVQSVLLYFNPVGDQP